VAERQALSPFRARASQACELLTVKEAALYLRVSTWLIRQLVTEGYLPRIRLPLPVTAHRRSGELRKVLIDRADIDGLIASGKTRAA